MRILLITALLLCTFVEADACQWAGRKPQADSAALKHARQPLEAGAAAPHLDVSVWLHGEGSREHKAGEATLLLWAHAEPVTIRAARRLLELDRSGESLRVVCVEWEMPGPSSFEHAVQRSSDGAFPDRMFVAWEDGSRTTHKYLGHRSRRDAEHAVLIGLEGEVAWIGPLSMMAEPISEVMAGTWSCVTGAQCMETFIDRADAAVRELGTSPALALTSFSALAREHPHLHGLFVEEHLRAAITAADMSRAKAVGALLIEREAATRSPLRLQRVARLLLDPGYPRDAGGLQLLDLAQLAEAIAERAVSLAQDSHPKTFAYSECKELLGRAHAWQGRRPEALSLLEDAYRDWQEVVRYQERMGTTHWLDRKRHVRRSTAFEAQVAAYRVEKAAQVHRATSQAR